MSQLSAYPALTLAPTAGDTRRPVAALWFALLAIATGLAMVVMQLQWSRPSPVIAIPPVRVVPRDLPVVAPLRFVEIAPTQARAINAAVPFVADRGAAARPFAFTGSAIDRESALTCLAAAEWYEAGDSAVGEAAVAQVILNRARHPAFPATVCGVVFQGSDRTTGCQFTFACDGSLRRRPSEAAWQRARLVATRALDGTVDASVGLATHYHTDWVVPYWSGTLDKLARVETQLFFKWRGGWGQRAAFARAYRGGERIDSRIIAFAAPELRNTLVMAPVVPADPALGEAVVPVPALQAVDVKGVTKAELNGSVVRLADIDSAAFVLQLDPNAFSGSYAVTAVTLCRGRSICSVFGFLQAERIPAALPLPVERTRTASFFYRRNRDAGTETVKWNCIQLPRPDADQCFPGTAPAERSDSAS